MIGYLYILNEKSEEGSYIKKIDNENSFIDLEQLKNILPLKNILNNEGIFEFSLQRAIDNSIFENKSILLSNENIGFMNIEINDNNNCNKSVIFNSNIFNQNFNNDIMNFTKNENSFIIPKTEIVFTSGRNIPFEKIKRILASLKRQSYTNFSLI